MDGQRNSTTFDYKVLIVTLGKAFVGKTCLAHRFVRDSFSELHFATVGALHLERIVEVEKTHIKCEIWDTAGAEQYESLTAQYWRKADGAVVVFDVTDESSFQRAQQWVEQLRAAKGAGFAVLLCGNKTDLEGARRVARRTAEQWAADAAVVYAETSAKTGAGVEAAFAALLRRVPVPHALAASIIRPQPQPPPSCQC